MAIYEYNSSTINEYSSDDCGLISSFDDDIFDCGELNSDVFDYQDFYVVTCFQTLHPFGSIKIQKTIERNYKKISTEFIVLNRINDKSFLLSRFILFWIGFGTIFEFNNGLERQVIPDVSGGGITK